MIWYKPYQLPNVAFLCKNNMVEHLGIELTEITGNSLKGKMPVDHRTKQPAGILHGGASVSLAESLGSIAATMVVDPEKFRCVGLDINANHIRQVTSGFVYGETRPIHIGRRTQVWSIEITNEEKKIVSICRLTMAVIEI